MAEAKDGLFTGGSISTVEKSIRISSIEYGLYWESFLFLIYQ